MLWPQNVQQTLAGQSCPPNGRRRGRITRSQVQLAEREREWCKIGDWVRSGSHWEPQFVEALISRRGELSALKMMITNSATRYKQRRRTNCNGKWLGVLFRARERRRRIQIGTWVSICLYSGKLLEVPGGSPTIGFVWNCIGNKWIDKLDHGGVVGNMQRMGNVAEKRIWSGWYPTLLPQLSKLQAQTVMMMRVILLMLIKLLFRRKWILTRSSEDCYLTEELFLWFR